MKKMVDDYFDIFKILDNILDETKELMLENMKYKEIIKNCLRIIKDDPELENYKSSELKRELLKGSDLDVQDRERQDS